MEGNREMIELRSILRQLGWRDEHDIESPLPIKQVTTKLRLINFNGSEAAAAAAATREKSRLSILNRQFRKYLWCEIVEVPGEAYVLEQHLACPMEWQQQGTTWSLHCQPNGLYSFQLNASNLSASTVSYLAKRLHLDVALPAAAAAADASASRGEKLISKILTNMNLSFEIQKTFPNLRDLLLLRFDFYVPAMQLLIEFDGEQHFRPIAAFGGAQAFELTKADYCRNSTEGLSLLRIGYWQLSSASQIIADATTRIQAKRGRLIHDHDLYLRDYHEKRGAKGN